MRSSSSRASRTASHNASVPARRDWTVLHAFTVDMSVRFIEGQPSYLASRGIAYEVASSPGPALTALNQREHVTTFGVPMLRRISPLRDLASLWQLIRLVRSRRPDAVHAHTPKAGLLLMLAAWLCRVPVRIYHVHGVPWKTARGLRGGLLRLSEAVACRCATHILCVSGSVRQALRDNGFASDRRTRILAGGSSNGIDARVRFRPRGQSDTAVRAVRERYDIPADAPVAGFVGRVCIDKGVRELAAAWPEVRAAFPDAHLLLIGPEEAHDPLPADVVAALKSDPSIHWHGPDWDTPRLFAACDLLVLPTYREGFPNVLLEAASMARPVVATRVDGCVDAVREGVTGTLVPPRDAQALATAISAYFADRSRRTREGALARAHIERGFSRETIWEALAEFYAECGAPALPHVADGGTITAEASVDVAQRAA